MFSKTNCLFKPNTQPHLRGFLINIVIYKFGNSVQTKKFFSKFLTFCVFVKSKNCIVMSTTFRFVFKKTQEPMVPCFCHWFWHQLSAYYSKHWTLSRLSVKPSLSASHLFFETMCYHWNALLVVLKGEIELLWDIFNYCFLPSLGKLNK